MKIDDVEYMVKPMNCPMHMMVYQSDPHSYRDLPLRISENASVYRYEQAGNFPEWPEVVILLKMTPTFLY